MTCDPATGFEKSEIIVYRENGFSKESVKIVKEVSLRIYLNDSEVATIACNGNYPGDLAVGFLYLEGFIENASKIRKIDVSDDEKIVYVFTKDDVSPTENIHRSPDTIDSSGGRSWRKKGPAPYREDLSARKIIIATKNVLDLMRKFVDMSRLHQITGGTHSAALTDGDRILVLREDIGRHNAIDMLCGHSLLNGIDCSDKIIVRTGRVSAEIVHKVWKLGVTVMISLSVPTSMAVHLCKEAGITLVGSVRGGRMNVYSHEWRIEN